MFLVKAMATFKITKKANTLLYLCRTFPVKESDYIPDKIPAKTGGHGKILIGTKRSKTP